MKYLGDTSLRKLIELIKTKIGVSGVKGNAESSYRTGDVNLTPANIGAMGAAVIESSTMANIVNTVRTKPGQCGSFNLSTAYTLSGITVATGWYNYIYIPHRDGVASDGPNYGTLIFTSITGDTPVYSLRYSNGALSQLKALSESGHSHSYLPLSGGTLTGRLVTAQGTAVHDANASGGTAGYLRVMTIKINEAYLNQPIVFSFKRRGDGFLTTIAIGFVSGNTADPNLNYIRAFGYTNAVWINKSGTSTWQVFIQKSGPWDRMGITEFFRTSYDTGATITFEDVFSSSVSGTQASWYIPGVDASAWRSAIGANNASNLNAGTVPAARLPQLMTTRMVTVSVRRAAGNSVSVSAPSVSGYTFVCWIESSTSGWVCSTYFQNPQNSTTNVWVASTHDNTSSGNGSVDCTALYRRTS